MTAMFLHLDAATVDAVAREVECPRHGCVRGFYLGEEPCETCRATGRVPDPSALRVLTVPDVPRVPCERCGGEGRVPGQTPYGHPIWVPCPDCEDGTVPWSGGEVTLAVEQVLRLNRTLGAPEWGDVPSYDDREDYAPAERRIAGVLLVTVGEVLPIIGNSFHKSGMWAEVGTRGRWVKVEPGSDAILGRYALVVTAVERLAEPVVEMVEFDGDTLYPETIERVVPLDLPLGVLVPVTLAEEARHG